MSEVKQHAQTSRLAAASFQLGALSLMPLLIGAVIVLQAFQGTGTSFHGPLYTEAARHFWVVDICAGVAAVAAFAGLVVGIVALAVPRDPGKVERRGDAVSGLVTSTLTLLTLISVLVVPMLLRDKKLESSNKLKTLGLAMHEYHEYYGHFPPAVLRDPGLGDRGQPYSWRVALLPFLGEGELFSQYRRDEQWDSPDNNAVRARMPPAFALPDSVSASNNLTHYQVIVGPGTAFERPELGARLFDFQRGGSQTILVVEATDPVPWTKPVDLSYAPDGSLPRVGGLLDKGLNALFADGTVRWIEAEKQENELRTHVLR
jgi:hypothetical protein